jgi:nitric oxide synthase oxygenase domain/subunit
MPVAEPGSQARIPAASLLAAGETRGGFAGCRDLLSPAWPPTGGDSCAADSLQASARQFITQFHDQNHAGPPDKRLQRVRHEIEATGTYWHTPAELAFGARVAWRNSSRCVGRLYWQSLRVRDRREATAAADVAAESVAHLREATNAGRPRSVITVFAPDAPDRPGPRILSPQLVRYAGHETADGTVIGDPANAPLTRLARALGWSGGRPRARFDILPLIVREAGARPTLHELPSDAVLEVPIRHPVFTWTWIVPTAATSATPVSHRYYQDFDQSPTFYRPPPECLSELPGLDDRPEQRHRPERLGGERGLAAGCSDPGRDDAFARLPDPAQRNFLI